MKKSFMNNIKNFVDSNVRQRIDRVAHHNSEVPSDDLLSVERHFEDIRQVCVDAEKKISAMLQSIQSSNPSHLGAYTQNVQAGLNHLSHNISLQAAGITSSTGSNNNIAAAANNNAKISDENLKNSQQQLAQGGELSTPKSLTPCNNTNTQQYHSSESLSIGATTPGANHPQIVPHPSVDLNCQIQENLSYDVQQRHKKLPVVGFYKFLSKSCNKLKHDSLLATAFSQFSHLQIQLAHLYLSYEQLIESQFLKPIQQMLETDIPNIVKLRKLYIKSHNDYDFIKAKYNGASLKQQQSLQPGHFTNTSYLISQNSIQQGNTNKLDQLKNELDEVVTRFEQARDTYESELYGFICREAELVNLLRMFYQSQAEYHRQVGVIMQGLLPSINDTLALTPRKLAFGTKLSEHLRCTGRAISPVIELSVHFLHSQGLREEGLFRIPGSSVKIKKLKNSINAWFVSLASLDELESDQKRQTGHSCVIALHDLFKNSVGQRAHKQQDQQSSTILSNSVLRNSLAAEGSILNQTNFSNIQQDGDEIILDVHSIAGLLKLYLRELPEPLFTHALYDDWISCVSGKVSNSERVDNLAKMLKKLPEANYANLKHLIKLLHQLTCHQEQNKMTSTNLAIAMAPSLIWSKPLESDQSTGSNADDAKSLNMQISSFGMSASLHAMILEALINNAESLFPEPSDFSLPGFSDLTLSANKYGSTQRARSVKSTSPTGLSTTSSSSFSSNTSNSAVPLKGHSRKGGSMEGLLGANEMGSVIQQQNIPLRNAGRPVSVLIRQDDYSAIVRQQNTVTQSPSKPPVPTARSHIKQSGSTISSHRMPLNSSNKPPAPPVPPPTSVRHQQERLKAAIPDATVPTNINADQKPRPTSLRGTGTIDASQVCHTATSSIPTNSLYAARPTVPPPKRPTSSDDTKKPENNRNITNATQTLVDHNDLTCKTESLKLVDDVGQGGSHSLVSSSDLRADIEENSGIETAGSHSPALSFDSTSNDDSSFDNESHDSLEQLSPKCSSASELSERVEASSTSATIDTPGDRSTLRAGENLGPTIKEPDQTTEDHGPVSGVKKNDDQTISGAPQTSQIVKRPPIKPPRSMSPKITQSTPL